MEQKNLFKDSLFPSKNFSETVTIIMFAIIAFYVSTGKSIQNFIPLTLIVVSAVRVIPSLSLISVSVTNIKFQQPSFNLIYNECISSKSKH